MPRRGRAPAHLAGASARLDLPIHQARRAALVRSTSFSRPILLAREPNRVLVGKMATQTLARQHESMTVFDLVSLRHLTTFPALNTYSKCSSPPCGRQSANDTVPAVFCKYSASLTVRAQLPGSLGVFWVNNDEKEPLGLSTVLPPS